MILALRLFSDLDLYLTGGKMTTFKPMGKPPYTKHSHFYVTRDRWLMYKYRNQDAAALRRQILYSDEYPEKIVVQFEEEKEEEEEDATYM